MVAAPAVEAQNGLAHGAYALWIFALPQLLSALLEAPLSIAADGVARGRIVALSMGVLAAALAACALSPAPWLLSLALALAGAASGIACSAAQVALVAARPGRAASAMTRWTAFAAAGDLLSPLVVAAALVLGGDHRSALAAIALVVGLHALLAARTLPGAGPPTAEPHEPQVPLRDAVRQALGNRRLRWLLFAEASCCLLDEVVVALAALRLHDDLGWSQAAAAASATAIALGGLAGALLAERTLERHAPRSVLLVSALISLGALVCFVAAHEADSAIAALALLGAASAAHHPLTRAAAYEQVPGRPGLVNALTQLFVPFEVGLPLLIGALASSAGLGPALLALSVQPLVMLVAVLAMCSASPVTAPATDTHRAINAVWRIESARVIAGLARMVRDVGLAEELAQDALVAALEHWPEDGVPDNPGAWLMATAKRRAIDHLRRDKRLERKHEEIGHDLDAHQRETPDLEAALDDDIGDDLLRLVFTACHPVLSTEARVALTLRLLGGLTTEEIARAFLVPEPTVAQRIVRAKRTLAEAGVPFEVPRGEELSARLASVLEVVYLIFNEGYSATAGDDWMRPALCDDALRLGRVLAGLAPLEPEVHGLVALMEIQASRARARTGPGGEPILLLDQNRVLWDQLLIRRGLTALAMVERLGGARGFYALQAAIAACHARARTADETDWQRITELYGQLAEVAPSPVVQLNRAVAVAMASGPAAGLSLVDELMNEPALEEYHLLFGVRGDLLFKLGRYGEARTELERAAALTRNARERTLLLERAAECERLSQR